MRLRKGCPARLLCPGDRRRGVLVEVCRDIPAMVFCVFAAGQLPANASTETVRVVKYGQDDVVTVHAKVRYVRPGNSTEYPPAIPRAPADRTRDSRIAAGNTCIALRG